MNETASILLMMNNYFHDVATALLLGSGFAMWVMYRKFVKDGAGDVSAIRSMYAGMTTLTISC